MSLRDPKTHRSTFSLYATIVLIIPSILPATISLIIPSILPATISLTWVCSLFSGRAFHKDPTSPIVKIPSAPQFFLLLPPPYSSTSITNPLHYHCSHHVAPRLALPKHLYKLAVTVALTLSEGHHCSSEEGLLPKRGLFPACWTLSLQHLVVFGYHSDSYTIKKPTSLCLIRFLSWGSGSPKFHCFRERMKRASRYTLNFTLYSPLSLSETRPNSPKVEMTQEQNWLTPTSFKFWRLISEPSPSWSSPHLTQSRFSNELASFQPLETLTPSPPLLRTPCAVDETLHPILLPMNIHRMPFDFEAKLANLPPNAPWKQVEAYPNKRLDIFELSAIITLTLRAISTTSSTFVFPQCTVIGSESPSCSQTPRFPISSHSASHFNQASPFCQSNRTNIPPFASCISNSRNYLSIFSSNSMIFAWGCTLAKRPMVCRPSNHFWRQSFPSTREKQVVFEAEKI
ncbi:uncharacterized protein BDR25DRAFT_356323 [Lindgomyces ingoldianus]|uniref:Uncharacterized protein n=1 Tax=Lindgomyces ingoldianus TaxID=673940 RepID=A0ACB6QRG2_9PLEO|nr:uncharacterized protein BDR25DRAFT_356323 [Lindgomyces ingoldianus]KAF2469593.1 hypothetical protein BDR25DRAFT_356323 [Lindgomyces ingoldianus]